MSKYTELQKQSIADNAILDKVLKAMQEGGLIAYNASQATTNPLVRDYFNQLSSDFYVFVSEQINKATMLKYKPEKD